jgi:hypothetical protein
LDSWVSGSSIGASTSRETYTLRRRRGEAAGRRRRCSLILTCLLASCTLDARRSDVAVWALCARASANTVRARVGYRAPTALKYVSAGVLPIRAGGRFGVGSGPSSTRLVVRKAARRDRRCFRLAGGPLASATSTCLAAGGGERDHRYCIWRRVLVFGGAGRVPRRSFSWRDTRERVGAEDGAHRVLSCGGGAGVGRVPFYALFSTQRRAVCRRRGWRASRPVGGTRIHQSRRRPLFRQTILLHSNNKFIHIFFLFTLATTTPRTPSASASPTPRNPVWQPLDASARYNYHGTIIRKLFVHRL